MTIERIRPAGLSNGPTYTHVVKTTGTTVYIAGQTPVDENGQIVGKGDITAQTEQVMQNIGKALASVGAGYDKLVKTTVFITDARYREAVGAVRNKYLAGHLPTSTLLVVAGLAQPEFLLEIEAIAVLD